MSASASATMEQRHFECEGLPVGEIIVGDIRDEVPETLVCSYFGPKSSKSGWKYNALTTLDEQAAILSLYQRVYDVEEMPNKEITLQFARGLILMSLEKSVNWSQFSKERRKYRAGLKLKRERQAKEKAEKDVVAGVSVGATNLVKRRCMATSAFPTSLKLSVKAECSGGGTFIGKKGPVAGKNIGSTSACWVVDEVNQMGRVIEDRSQMVNRCRNLLFIVSHERVAMEDKLRQARMLLSDRQVLINEAKVTLVELGQEELCVRVSIEESSEDVGGVDALMAQLETILFSKQCQERTSRLGAETILNCKANIVVLESELKNGLHKERELEQKVKSLEGLVGGMNEQLRSMTEGGGAVFWPRPISNSPELPLIQTHTINACPVCCLWYSCFDFVPVSCGHCYHAWCLHEHTKFSSECLVSGCNVDLRGQNGISLGLRPQVVKSFSTNMSSVVAAPSKRTPLVEIKRIGATTQLGETSQGTSESEGNKEIHGTQSSETNPTPPKVAADPVEGVRAPVICFVCNKKPAAVSLRKCGHALFCFSCIQGKKECPFCFEVITQWDPLAVASKPQAQLLSLAGACKSSIIRKRSARGSVKVPIECPSRFEVEKSCEFSDSDSERGAGLVHWCGDEEFSEGGARSMEASPTQMDLVAEHVIVEICEEDGTPASDKSVSTQVVADKEQVELGQVYTRERGLIHGDELVNHTRVVEKPLSELLGAKPIANEGEKVHKKTIAYAAGEKYLKKVTLTASNLVHTRARVSMKNSVQTRGRVTSRTKTIPARLQDL